MSLRKRISAKSSASAEEEFKRFIIAKKAKGLADKTLKTYQQHLSAIGKHLDLRQSIEKLNDEQFGANDCKYARSGTVIQLQLLYCAFVARQGQATCRRWLPGSRFRRSGSENLELSIVYLHV